MSQPPTLAAPREPVTPAAAITFTLTTVMLIGAAFLASFLGRFASHAALESTRAEASYPVMTALIVVGPLVIAAVALGLGIVRLVKRRSACWVPAVGIALIAVNFSVVARLLSP